MPYIGPGVVTIPPVAARWPVGHRTLVHKSRPREDYKSKGRTGEKWRSDLPECAKTAGTCLNCGERVSCVRADISL